MEEEYRRLMARVLRAVPGLSAEELESMVEEKLRTQSYLNKVGALLLVAEELGVFEGKEEAPEEVLEELGYSKVADLVPGLNDVSLKAVIYGVEGPIQVKGHKLFRLKVGDRTGTVEVTAWDEKAEEVERLELKMGDMVAVIHGYTRERLETGRPEIHMGRNGAVRKLEPEPGMPEPTSFFKPLSDVLGEGEGIYDVRAKVLEVGEPRSVRTPYGEAEVMDVVLGDGRRDARLTAWREKVAVLKKLRPGDEVYITDVRLRDDRLTLTPRSILALVKEGTGEQVPRRVERNVLRVLDVVEGEAATTLISTDGESIIRVICAENPGVKTGDHIEVKGAPEERRGKKLLRCDAKDVRKVEQPREEIAAPNLKVNLERITGGEVIDARDIVVEGTLYTKTNPVAVETRFGPAEKMMFWLKEGDEAVQGVAWRTKAKEMSRIPEGARVRLKWVSVRLNPFNEPEIQLESDSKIEVIEDKPSYKGTASRE